MFFDLINALTTFQAYINQALQGLVDDFYVIYLNDILIFSKSEEEHHQHFELIIQHLQNAKLYTNPKKCKFFKFELKFLNFIINLKEIQMNFIQIKTISE